MGAQSLLALQLQTLVGDVAGLHLGVEHVEGVAGGRCAVETEDDGGLCGSGRIDSGVTLVEHGLDTSVTCSGDHVVAHAQCTVGHEHGGDVAAALVERRLDD